MLFIFYSFTQGGAWEKALLKKIDADVLPKHWGGTRVDPDGNPKCPSVVSGTLRNIL